MAPDAGSLLHGHVTAISKLSRGEAKNHQETGISLRCIDLNRQKASGSSRVPFLYGPLTHQAKATGS